MRHNSPVGFQHRLGVYPLHDDRVGLLKAVAEATDGKFLPSVDLCRVPKIAAALQATSPGSKRLHTLRRLQDILYTEMTPAVGGSIVWADGVVIAKAAAGGRTFEVRAHRGFAARAAPYYWSVTELAKEEPAQEPVQEPVQEQAPPARIPQERVVSEIATLVEMLVDQELAIRHGALVLAVNGLKLQMAELVAERNADIGRALEEGKALGRTEVRDQLRAMMG